MDEANAKIRAIAAETMNVPEEFREAYENAQIGSMNYGNSVTGAEYRLRMRLIERIAALTQRAELAESRVKELEIELESAQNTIRAYDGLVALKNGIPETTGDAVFDKVLAVYPVAEMIQRGWLGSATGFTDLPFLEKQLCRFFEAGRLADLLNEDFFKEPAPDSAPVGGKE